MAHGSSSHILDPILTAQYRTSSGPRPPVAPESDPELDSLPDADPDAEHPSLEYAGICEYAPLGEPGVFGLSRGRQHPEPKTQKPLWQTMPFAETLALPWNPSSC